MNLEVLDVGDGACSILSDALSVMLVDCGSGRKGRAQYSAKILAAALGPRSADIDTVVITHFDADHWMGLWALPEEWDAAPSEVTVYYPYLLPFDEGVVQIAHLATQAVTAQTPVSAALDIVDAWRAKGVTVHVRALSRGDDFSGAGTSWKAHWPPRDGSSFPSETRTTIRELAEEIRKVAEENSVFHEALYAVQKQWLAHLQEEIRGDIVATRTEEASDSKPLTSRRVIDSLKRQLGTRGWTDLRARIRKYNNALSLVHTSDTIANFGDCEGVGLTALLKLQGVRPPTLAVAYPIVFAPHHGTQIPGEAVTPMFPYAARALVCQNGGPTTQRAWTTTSTGSASE